jgi:hypothetical protein
MATPMPLRTALTQVLRTLKNELCNPYRPELHYMRGPGPKWFEKQALRPVPIPVRLRPAQVSHSRSRFS